jgi:hypothetical protein
MDRFLCLMLSGGMALAFLPAAHAEDLDEDGLDDALEDQLLQLHAPFYRFHSGEDTAPAGVIWYIRRSELLYRWSFLEVSVASQDELIADPSVVLRKQAPPDSTIHSSYVNTPAQTGFVIALVDEDRDGYGQPWEEVLAAGNIGLFGHVVLNPADQDEIIIQYWQFFAYSDDQGPAGGGDHQGDWVYLDLYVSRLDHSLKRVVYHHHGDTNCSRTICPDECALPADGRPICFLEEGTHEWWPWASDGGECNWGPWGNDGHDGGGCRHRQSHDETGNRQGPGSCAGSTPVGRRLPCRNESCTSWQ